MNLKNKRNRLYAFFLLFTFLFISVIYIAAESREQEKISIEASLFNGEKSFGENNIESDIPEYLVPLGTVFGIKLYTDGVIVSSLEKIDTPEGSFSPASDAGVKPGDFIVEVENVKIENNAELRKLIAEDEDGKLKLLVRRDGGYFSTEVSLIKENGKYKAGMWIRDSAAGIGTLTYYNPETMEFGGLGHGICDIDAGKIMTLKEGQPENIIISGIIKGERGIAGRIKGYFSGDDALGVINKNLETGIYGKLNFIPEGEKMMVAKSEEITPGKAEILATVDNSGVCSYEIKITDIFRDGRKTKNMVIEITDEYLLEKTGGIIQGLSGCPIIQNGKLIGAVTHVFLENPSCGYGIFIENMLSTAL